MIKVVLKIFDFLKEHSTLRHLSFVALTILLLLSMFSLSHKEDISDFLPLGTHYTKAMGVYQQITGADKIIITLSDKDSTDNPDAIIAAVENLEERLLQSSNPLIQKSIESLSASVDFEKVLSVPQFVYNNIPYFLTEKDYMRADSLLSSENYISQKLKEDKQALLFPVGGFLSQNISKDPLNLFSPVVELLQQRVAGVNYQLIDGYIFSPDSRVAIVTLTSPFGSSETQNNGSLIKAINEEIAYTQKVNPQVKIVATGGPVIALGNSHQIKKDSFISVTLAVVLILLLLFVCFKSKRNLLLIALSILWGWLFAMGALALVHDSISVIVVGISSVILGIAVNYPLHLVAHLNYVPNVREALKEVTIPLLVGNVTTVGAFLALVPLKSTALSDLGLFAAFLLLGTIIFVLLYLPHVVKDGVEYSTKNLFSRFGEVNLENKRWIIICVAVLTVVFWWCGRYTSFDADISNINYMNSTQKSTLEYLQNTIINPSSSQIIYRVGSASSPMEALEKAEANTPIVERLKKEGVIESVNSFYPFFSSKKEQERRLSLWREFKEKYAQHLNLKIREEGLKEGFASDSFDEFFEILNREYTPKDFEYFAPLKDAFATNLVCNPSDGIYSAVEHIYVKDKDLQRVESELGENLENSYWFDVKGMTTAVAGSLAEDFDYIGWACSLIVFFFLWFSLGSLELAIISFLPMAVSWIWILGIMGITGVQFNVVNIILATFIFGQGDDYTIFMTEGCQYEYAYRKKMIASYKNGITISALIMFIGIGTLIFARHPALRSLAEVTIIGMFSVVLMAYLLPPLVFKWMVSRKGEFRQRPLSVNLLINKILHPNSFKVKDEFYLKTLVVDRYRYRGRDIFSAVKKRVKKYDNYSEWFSDKEVGENLAGKVVVLENGYGECSLSLALHYPQKEVIAFLPDADSTLIATYAAEGVVSNLKVICGECGTEDECRRIATKIKEMGASVVLSEPDAVQKSFCAQFNPIIIES